MNLDADGPDNNDACVPVEMPGVGISIEKFGICDVNQICRIEGAQFELYDTEPTGSATPIPDGVVASATSASTFTATNLSLHTDYWLVETRAPAGHNLLAAPIKFQVTSTGIVLTSPTIEGAVVTVTGSNQLTMTITDTAAGDLPEAGGDGFLPFLTIGLVLMCLAGITQHKTSGREATQRGNVA